MKELETLKLLRTNLNELVKLKENNKLDSSIIANLIPGYESIIKTWINADEPKYHTESGIAIDMMTLLVKLTK